jgi:hypothetical protein
MYLNGCGAKIIENPNINPRNQNKKIQTNISFVEFDEISLNI